MTQLCPAGMICYGTYRLDFGVQTRWKRRLIRSVRIVVIAYVLIALIVAGCQRSLIFPGHASQGQSRAALPKNLDGEVLHLKTAKGADIVCWFAGARDRGGQALPDAADRPTILYFNGNATLLTWSINLLQSWQNLGVNVMGVEYPGFGLSTGESGEPEFYAAADAAYDELIRRGIRPGRIIAAGQSMGTGVAVDLAYRRPVGGVALFAPYTSMNAMAHQQFPWLPTSWFLQHHFRSDQKIGSITIPILIMRGSHDSIIPPTMSEQLAKAAMKSPSVDLVLVNSDHNDLFTLARSEVEQAMAQLLTRIH